MTLIRFYYYTYPFAGFERLFYQALYSHFSPPSSKRLRRANHIRRPAFYPRMNVKESEDANDVTATLELPGLKPDEVTINLHEHRLTISGESTPDALKGAGYAIRERHRGKFSRRLQVPSGTKAGDVKAKMENGLLTVTFPKAITEQPHRVTIQ